MNFTPDYSASIKPTSTSLCLFFDNESIWIYKDSFEKFLPCIADFPDNLLSNKSLHPIGQLDNTAVFLIRGNAECIQNNIELPNQFEKKPLRELFNQLLSGQHVLINLGFHVFQWDMNSQYCGHCGSAMNFMQQQLGKVCGKCTHSVYPLIMPCVIVAIIKDNSSILLAEINRPDFRIQSVLAGFIEAGETLEAAVTREVKEEVAINIKNIKYYGSQPWSFSQSLMIAFTAEYDSGEIQVDGEEIQHAAWYTVDQLVDLPLEFSIARELIENFRKKYA